MKTSYWQPLIAMRFVEREVVERGYVVNGKKRILQQLWGLHSYNVGKHEWQNSGQGYKWVDVPLQDEKTPPNAEDWIEDYNGN